MEMSPYPGNIYLASEWLPSLNCVRLLTSLRSMGTDKTYFVTQEAAVFKCLFRWAGPHLSPTCPLEAKLSAVYPGGVHITVLVVVLKKNIIILVISHYWKME